MTPLRYGQRSRETYRQLTGSLHALCVHSSQQLLMMAFLPFRSPTADWRGLGQPRPEIVALCRSLTATANGKIGQPPALRLRNPWGMCFFSAANVGPKSG